MTAPARMPHSIALTLSGGGHRASLFTLGALMYVVDAGRNRDTTSIASVSGGSMTNGFVGQTLDYRQTTPEEFAAKVVKPLARRVAVQGTLFAPLFTKLYLASLVVGFIAALLPLWCLSGPWWVRHLATLTALLAWGWLVGLRGRVCAEAFRATLYSPGGRATPLVDIQRGVSHVICATEMHTAESLYFSGDFVYGFQFGPGKPGTLPLYRAVQASAAFPGGFPPARIPRGPLHFEGSLEPGKAAPPTRNLVLTDGGVYDNMGEQWARGFADRKRLWLALANEPNPTQLIVVNASARVPWTPFRSGGIPLLSEIIALLRVINIMYINTTNVRRQDIVDSFSPFRPVAKGELPGALIQIAQSPFDVASRFAKVENHPVGARARDVIALLGAGTKAEWERIAEEDSAVDTTLSCLGTDVSARLLRHGYMTAMCNLHVLFGDASFGGWPLLQPPDVARFGGLVQ